MKLRAALLAAAGAACFLPRPARADGALGRDGAPIRTSGYGVDLTQTPVLAGSRVTGLAGAYVAIGEGTDGDTQTPAAPAVRPVYSVDHFDFDLGLGFTLPATLTSTDFFNTGKRTQLGNAKQGNFVFFTPALNLAFGKFGLGATLEIQDYSLRDDNTGANGANRLSAQFAAVHVQLASLFAAGQLAVGGGARILDLDVTDDGPGGSRDLFTTAGVGIELGALAMPRGLPFRVGAAFRSAVSTRPDPQSSLTPNAVGDRVIGDPADPAALYLPNRVEQPWDLNVGLAVQMGPRPFNVPFHDPNLDRNEERLAVEGRAANREATRNRAIADGMPPAELDALDRRLTAAAKRDESRPEEVRNAVVAALKRRNRDLPRRYVLVSMSVLLTGSTADAVGIESFLSRVVERSGRRLSYSPRLGVETELVPHWVKVRAGTYGEPTRFRSSGNRLHGTFGFDVKLFPWRVFGLYDEGTEWRLSASLDAAPRFFGWGLGVGVWH